MTAIQLSCFTHQTTSGLPYQHLRIQITSPDGLVTPDDLRHLQIPADIAWGQGVVIEGRAPIWLYGHLVHACHPARWIACFDPRLGDPAPKCGGAVVVATHGREVSLGDVLKITLPDQVEHS